MSFVDVIILFCFIGLVFYLFEKKFHVSFYFKKYGKKLFNWLQKGAKGFL